MPEQWVFERIGDALWAIHRILGCITMIGVICSIYWVLRCYWADMQD